MRNRRPDDFPASTATEGDWFDAPIPGGFHAVGRVLRCFDNGAVLVRFFGPVRPDPFRLDEAACLRPRDRGVTLLAGDAALASGRWSLLGRGGFAVDRLRHECLHRGRRTTTRVLSPRDAVEVAATVLQGPARTRRVDTR